MIKPKTNSSYSVLLDIIIGIICLLAIVRTLFISFWSESGGNTDSVLDSIYNVKGTIYVGALAFLAVLGTIRRKQKMRYLPGFSLSVILLIYGFVGMILGMLPYLSLDSSETSGLALNMVLGIGLVALINLVFKNKVKITDIDWTVISISTAVGLLLLFLDLNSM